MPPKKWPRARLKATTRYRFQERTPETRRAHAKQTTAWRREMAEADFPPELRSEVLELIESGVSVVDAATELGTTWQKVYGLASFNADFSRALDEATQAACVCGGQPWKRVEGRRRCFCPAAREYRAREAREYRERQRSLSLTPPSV